MLTAIVLVLLAVVALIQARSQHWQRRRMDAIQQRIDIQSNRMSHLENEVADMRRKYLGPPVVRRLDK